MAPPARQSDPTLRPTAEDTTVTVGPVQLLVVGFEKPDFHGEVLAEFDRLKLNDVVRIIDGLAVYKDLDGNVSTLQLGQLDREDRAEFGAKVGALIGLGAAGEEGMELGAEIGAEQAMDGNILPADVIDVLDEIPPDSAAAILLIEHRWAIPARDALRRAGGYNVVNVWVNPLDLYEIGVATRGDIDADQELVDNADKVKNREATATPA